MIVIMKLIIACFLCGLSALGVDLIPLSALLPYWLVPVVDTLLGHGALAGVAWALGSSAWASARGSSSWGNAISVTYSNTYVATLAQHLLPRGPAAPGAAMWAIAVAIAVDADHFIAARSFRLRDALSLPARPFGHALTTPIMVVGAAALAVRFAPNSQLPSWTPVLIALSWLSHLTKDAVKRGFLLGFPFAYSSPLLPYGLYVAALAAAPAIVSYSLSALAPPLRALPGPQSV
jgi:hypothetical protein